jgi:hypothetical protein
MLLVVYKYFSWEGLIKKKNDTSLWRHKWCCMETFFGLNHWFGLVIGFLRIFATAVVCFKKGVVCLWKKILLADILKKSLLTNFEFVVDSDVLLILSDSNENRVFTIFVKYEL